MYIEINAVCICILLILVYVARRGVVRETEQLVFTNLCFHSILLFFLDILWRLCNGRSFLGAHSLNNLLCAAFFIQSVVLGYFWLRYSYFINPNRIMGRSLRRFAFAIPLILLIIMNILSVWTGWIFTVDEHNFYHKGSVYWVQPLVGSLYLLFAITGSWPRSFKRNTFSNRQNLLVFTAMGVLPFVSVIFQLAFSGLSVFCVGVTLGLLFIFMEKQHHLISIDPLTRLNNRTQLISFMETKMNVYNRDKRLMLFLMDFDFFKQINDKFGHMEGDRALVIFANVLKRELGPLGFFIARIGGDEFVTVAEMGNIADANAIRPKLEKALEAESEKLAYKISVSIGFAERMGENDTIQDLFKRADQELYKVKSVRHGRG